jgi:hypothetical protein
MNWSNVHDRSPHHHICTKNKNASLNKKGASHGKLAQNFFTHGVCAESDAFWEPAAKGDLLQDGK